MRSFAAETIFMALVICCVFLTERMRRRMSIRLGIYFGFVLLHEARLEFLERRVHLRLELVVQRLLLANRGQHRRMRVLDELIQPFFERAGTGRAADRRGTPSVPA